jgi:hypothetical protein
MLRASRLLRMCRARSRDYMDNAGKYKQTRMYSEIQDGSDLIYRAFFELSCKMTLAANPYVIAYAIVRVKVYAISPLAGDYDRRLRSLVARRLRGVDSVARLRS